jgi:hypothetical protein
MEGSVTLTKSPTWKLTGCGAASALRPKNELTKEQAMAICNKNRMDMVRR